jgi:CO dehydrogenase maturation factor
MSLPAGPRAVPLAGNSHAPQGSGTGVRIVITGKGGVGKTTLTALLAHEFARHGKKVLAVDGDPQQNLAATLGLPVETAGRIAPVSESAAYLREKTGASFDIPPGGLLTLNPDVSDVIDRFSVRIAHNLRLLVMGGVRQAGSGCLCPEYTLLAAILRHMRLLGDDVVLLDTPAGLEHFGRAVADGFTCAVVVTDPSYNALAVARESAALARQLGIGNVILAVNRVHGDPDMQKVRERMKGIGEFPRVIVVPFNPDVFMTEPEVVSLLSAESPFMDEIRRLANLIVGRCEAEAGLLV